jgi:hypothetical protein
VAVGISLLQLLDEDVPAALLGLVLVARSADSASTSVAVDQDVDLDEGSAW